MYSSSEESSEPCFKNTTKKIYNLNNDKGNFCPMCREVFPDFLSTLNHLCRPFKCEDCTKTFEYDYQYTIHKCDTDNETKLDAPKCRFCNSVFGRLSLLELHETSCFKKKKQHDKCKVKVSPCLKKYKVSKRKNQNRINQPNLSYDDVHCNNKTIVTENSSLMDSKKSQNNLNSTIPSLSNLPVEKALHFSGKFKNSKRNKNKPFSEISKACNDDNVQKIRRKRKKLNKLLNFEVPQEETYGVTTESSNNVMFSNTMPESNMSTNEEVTGAEMNLKHNVESKDATSVKVVLSDIQKLPTVNVIKENKVENKKSSKKEMAKTDMLIMKNFAKKLKVTLESTSNVTFNGIHSSHSPDPKIKPHQENQASVSNKCAKRKRKVTRKRNNPTTTFQSLEKDDSDFSLKEFSSDRKKIKQSRSNSKDHDSGLELFETSSSSSSSSVSIKSAISEKRNRNRSKKFPSNSEMENSIQVSDSPQQKGKKDNARKKSIINKSNNVLKTTHTPLELIVSESTLNDTPDDIHSRKYQPRKYHPRAKNYYIKGKKSLTNKVKTDNNVELGDLLSSLPPQSGILLRSNPASFHSFTCPKCNKLFKHLKTGSNHLVSCRVLKYKKNLTVACDRIIYVCTACHYNSTRKSDLSNHKVSCAPNSIIDILFNYDGTNKKISCPTCTFSCWTDQIYEEHSCTRRLKYMQDCIVHIEKINPYNFKLPDGRAIKCEPGENSSQSMALAYNKFGQACVQKEKKNVIKNLEKCNTVTDVMKKVVKPVLECNERLEPGNLLPDLTLDVTIPYEHQKLLAEFAETALSENKYDEEFLGDEEFLNLLQNDDDDDDDDDSKFDGENDELLTRFRNYKCQCKNKTSDAESSSIDKKPCVQCLNKFLEEHVLTDPGLNLKMPTESKDLQQEIDNQTASSSLHNLDSSFISNNRNSSINTLSEVSSLSVSNNKTGNSEKHKMSTKSFDTCTNSSTSDDACFSNAEMQLKTVSSSAISSDNGNTSTNDLSLEMSEIPNINAKHVNVLPNDSEVTVSNRLQLDAAVYDNKCASKDMLIANCDDRPGFVKRHCEDISDDIIPYESHVPPIKINNPEDFHEQNELHLSTSNVSSEPEIIRKGRITIRLFNTDCKAEVFTSEATMTVTAGGIDGINLKCKQFQTLLFDLFVNLQTTISVFEDNADIFLKVLNIISDEELNVDIDNKSVHLHIPFTFDESIDYSAFVLKESGIGCCEVCDEDFTFPILIKHIIQEHQQTDIYISIT